MAFKGLGLGGSLHGYNEMKPAPEPTIETLPGTSPCIMH